MMAIQLLKMRTSRRRAACVAALVVLSMISPWTGIAGQVDHEDPEQVARGADVYVRHCASCHGAKLEGQPNWRTRKPDGRLPAPPHDVTGHTWHHPDAILFSITKNGTAAHAPAGYLTDMPGFGAVLSDEEIWSVLAFIQSHWPTHILARRKAATTEKEK